ncbi:MAG: M42 family metallopeptidase [Clostridium sp.]
MEFDINILKELSNADGISGYEKEVSRITKGYFEKYTDEISYDNLGSIIGIRKGSKKGKKIMISAHMDEVGFIVRGITKEGYIKLLPIGGWWGHVIPAQMMRITTESGEKIKGVVISKAPHGMSKEEKEKVIEPKNLYIDLGVDNRGEVLSLGVKIGDMITPDVDFSVMNNKNYFLGKAFDDRVGLGIIIEILKILENEKIDSEVYGVGSVQEEVGIRGARTATNLIKPDLAIAIDVTKSLDTPFEEKGIGIGEGINITMADALTMGNKEMIKKMKEICEEFSLDFNMDCMMDGGTDACNIHKTGAGVKAMTISIPTRYMHSPRLVIHKKDYLDTVKLLVEFIKRI